MDSIDKLTRFYNNSDQDDIYHEITGYILKNLTRLQDATIYDLAEWCYSSTSTISRLVKKLGFESFGDFKTKVCATLKEYRYVNRNMVDLRVDEDGDIVPLYFNFLKNNIDLLKSGTEYEKIKEISDLFHRYEAIYFYSSPEVGLGCIQEDLMVTGKESCIFKTYNAQKKNIEKLDEHSVVFAIIPDLREMVFAVELLKAARRKGAVTVILCSSRSSAYVKYADYVLEFDGTKTAFDSYLFMITVNLLTWDYRRRYVDNMIDGLEG